MSNDRARQPLSPGVLVRPELRALSPYHVPDSSGLVKLDAMENPYSWPGDLRDQWLQQLSRVSVNRYPDPAARPLKSRLRDTMGIPQGADILLGNGSDEIIQLLAMAFAIPGRSVMAPEPSFAMYRMIATYLGLPFIAVPLGADFELDSESMRTAMAAHEPAVTFLAQPNNPTGNVFEAEAIRSVIGAAPGIVVVDEAYFPFTDETMLPEVLAHPNLLVMRTVSKMGLAGLRLGFLVGAREWLAEIDKLRLPYNINVLTQLSAEFALDHVSVLTEQTQRIRRDRNALARGLGAVEGIRVFPSEANFLLFRTPPSRADAIFQDLRSRGVLIKNLSGQQGPLKDCLRVTVGTAAENCAFLDALRDCV